MHPYQVRFSLPHRWTFERNPYQPGNEKTREYPLIPPALLLPQLVSL
jgi:hypothetical protein